MAQKITYPRAYCLELDRILPPDNARDAHASHLNPDINRNFTFFCEDASCGCKMKGNRINRWESGAGMAYYSLWPNIHHSESCIYKDFNNKKISGKGGDATTRPEFERSYPNHFITYNAANQLPYHVDLTRTFSNLDDLLLLIKNSNSTIIDWKNVPINDLRIIVESYKEMENDKIRSRHFIRFDNEKIAIQYKNKFTIFKWLVSIDFKYAHVYFGSIKNKYAKEEIINNIIYYSFYLDWETPENKPHKHADFSYKILINKGNLNNTYFTEIFNLNIVKKIEWVNMSLYALDPKFIFLLDKRTIEIILDEPRHFVITETL